ncbi:MAG: 4-phosphoerythronate dehydrogenase, partial [Rikenellaceae bacterium]|nr:4-phosphoerythronate dehydrogenase [Rikenellaceae bacterium]
MKIVIDDKIPFIRGVFEPYAEVAYLPGGRIDAETVRDADALIVRTRTRCDAALLEGSAVRMIATATIGYDHIDMEYCRERGIRVATAAGCNARGVLQWFCAALLAMD